MSRFSWLHAAWRDLTHRRQVDREFDEELRAYVDLLTEEKVRAGRAPATARREALAEIGGVDRVKEEVRDVRLGAAAETFVRDARVALRGLRRQPGFALAAVLTLGLAIGASSAILSVVDAVLLKPLPYRDPGALVVVLNEGRNPVGPASFVEWQRDTHAFSGIGAAELFSLALTSGDHPEKLPALRVTSGLLPLLGVQPLLGSLWSADADQPGRDHVAVLSYRLWDRVFARDPGIVGRQVQLNGEPYTVLGVMPQGFMFTPFWATNAELVTPLALGPRAFDHSGWSLRVFARLRPGATLAQARAEVAAITARMEREFPGSNRDAQVVPLINLAVGAVRTPLFVLLGAVGFVLLIACANVAHMLLARASARQREMAVRAALGASRARVVRQLLTESLVIAAGGGVLGVGLAALGLRALVTLGRTSIPRVEGATLDSRVLAATALVTLATALVFGLVPALRTSTVRLAGTLRDGGRGTSDGPGRHAFRSTLIASEFALALMLLVGAGLMMRSFVALASIQPGFDASHLLTMQVSVSGTPEATPGRAGTFYQRVLEATRAVPGVASASAINHLPIAGDVWGWPFWVEGRPAPRPEDRQSATYRVVFPGYFETMRIPLVRGRDFTPSDRQGSAPVVIVNEWMARHYWPGQDVIGKRISLGDPATDPEWVTIVGVTKDVAQGSLTQPMGEEMYLPALQQPNYLEQPKPQVGYMTLVVRADCRRACDAAALAPAIRGAIASIDPQVPLAAVQTMDTVLRNATARPRFYLVLLGIFAVVALVLAAVGIYGVTSYSVSRRTHEIGLRLALGAEPAQLLRQVVREGMVVAVAGAGAGFCGALLCTRLLRGILYGVPAHDPITFAGVTAILCGVALAASWIPARRATRITPLEALRGS